jgi:hypothetical protein
VVNHGADGTVARPNASVVYWIGTAVPLNGAPTDLWYGSSSAQPQSLTDTLTQANSYTDSQIANLPASYLTSAGLAAGEFVPRRHFLNGITAAMGSGILYGPCFTADKTETISNVTYYTGDIPAAATPSLIQVGIYSLDSSGNATLVASTPNDTTLFAAANTAYSKALTSSFTKNQGTRYFIGLLIVSTHATPDFVGQVGPASALGESGILAVVPAISLQLSGQASLPASILVASLNTGTRNMPVVRLG